MTVPAQLTSAPFTMSDAKDAGLNRHQLHRLVLDGQVVQMLYGVYRTKGLLDSVQMRCLAVARVMKPFGVLCDRTAAWLHGVDTFGLEEHESIPRVDSFVLRGHSRTRRDVCRGGSRDLVPTDVMQLFGVWVTTPLRTALDLGCLLGKRDALASLDGFMRRCGVTYEEMLIVIPRYRRRRGVVQLRSLVPLATPLAESPGESWTRMALIQAGLPVPWPQFWVLHNGAPRYRLDLAYPWAKVAIEYDGRAFHSTKRQCQRDLKRRSWLRAQGWTVIVVTKESFTFEAWMSWTNEVSAALRAD